MKKYFFGEYLPKRFDATSEQAKVREFVWQFKNGEKEAIRKVVDMVVERMRSWYGDTAGRFVIVPVPAASMAAYRHRFAYFCVAVANRLKQANPMQHIIIDGQKEALHRSTDGHVEDSNYRIQLDAEWFMDKQCIIFDDVFTHGRSSSEFAQQLTEAGAQVVGGMFLARTIYPPTEQEQEPQAQTPRPIPTKEGSRMLMEMYKADKEGKPLPKLKAVKRTRSKKSQAKEAKNV